MAERKNKKNNCYFVIVIVLLVYARSLSTYCLLQVAVNICYTIS